MINKKNYYISTINSMFFTFFIYFLQNKDFKTKLNFVLKNDIIILHQISKKGGKMKNFKTRTITFFQFGNRKISLKNLRHHAVKILKIDMNLTTPKISKTFNFSFEKKEKSFEKISCLSILIYSRNLKLFVLKNKIYLTK